MPITQAWLDGFNAKIAELKTMLGTVVADPPVGQLPPDPPAANPYLDRTHPGTLTSHESTQTLVWQIGPQSNDAQGRMRFMANGSTVAALWGLRLVLQDDKVYAKQPDGSWLQGTSGGGRATTVVVNDPVSV